MIIQKIVQCGMRFDILWIVGQPGMGQQFFFDVRMGIEESIERLDFTRRDRLVALAFQARCMK